MVMLGEVPLVEGNGELEQAVQVQHRLAGGHEPEARGERHAPLKDRAPRTGDGHLQCIAHGDAGAVHEARRDVRPQVAVRAIDHGNHAAQRALVACGGHHRQPHDGRAARGAHIVKGDLARGKARPEVGKDVAAVEGVRALRPGEPLASHVDLAHFADFAGQQGECAVVGRDDELSGGGARHDAAPFGADARVDDGDEHRAQGPERRDLPQAVRRLPDVEGLDLVGEVDDAQCRVDAESDAFH